MDDTGVRDSMSQTFTSYLSTTSPTIVMIEPFSDARSPHDLPQWLNNYEARSGMSGWTDKQRIDNLPVYLQGALYTLYTTSQAKAGFPVTWPEVKRKVIEWILPEADDDYKRNRIEHFKQHTLPVVQYINMMRGYCLQLDPNMSEKRMIGYILRGMNKRLRINCIPLRDSTITNLMAAAQQLEHETEFDNVVNYSEEKKQDTTKDEIEKLKKEIEEMKKSRAASRSPDTRVNNRRNMPMTNYQTPQSRNQSNIICYWCTRRGHRESECRTKQRANELRNQNKQTRTDTKTKSKVTWSDTKTEWPKSSRDNNNDIEWPVSNMVFEQPFQAKETVLNAPSCGKLIKGVVEVEGIPFSALYDSGSNVTLITQEVQKATNLTPLDGGSYDTQAANMSRLNIIASAMATFRLLIPNVKTPPIRSEVRIVPDLPCAPVLIGQNILATAGIVLDCTSRHIQQSKNARQNLHVDEGLIIPARTSIAVNVVTSHDNPAKGTFFLSTPDHIYLRTKVCLQNSIITMKNFRCQLPLTNFTGNNVRLRKGTLIGTCEELERQNRQFIHMVKEMNNHWEKSSEEILKSIDKQHFLKDESLLTTIEIANVDVKIGNMLSQDEKDKLSELIQKYLSTFSIKPGDLGISKTLEHSIPVLIDTPISTAPRRQSDWKRKLTQKLVDEQLALDIIEPSCSPYSSPIVLVKKKTGDWRFCVDYRALNRITKRDIYPLPNIGDILGYLNGSLYFSSLDLKSGYHQISVKEEDRPKTAFITTDGLYQYKVMPFGLTNAPACFSRNMDIVLSGLKYNSCLVYLDDILIFAPDFETHLARLEKVFIRLRDANLKLNLEKSLFCLSEITFLGYHISADGQSPSQEKIKAVKDFPRPNNIHDIRAFVGLCSFYRKFIQNFADKARPLTHLIKKDVPFIWEEAQENAFQTLKTALINAPVLTHFDPNLPVEVRTDASDYGLGAVLVQKHEKGYKPVAYCSRQMNSAELNYIISEKECLAVIFAIEKFRPFLEGRHFKVVTDHHSLCFLRHKNSVSPRLTRWALLLQEFDYEIVYKAGKLHMDADCLSRYPTSPPEDSESRLDYRAFVGAVVTLFGENLSLEQSKDKYCSAIKDRLLNGFTTMSNKEKHRFRHFIIKNEILYRRIWRLRGEIEVIVAPRSMIKKICAVNHDDIHASHAGLQKTYERISEKYFWPGMYRDIVRYVQTCESCQRRNLSMSNVGMLSPLSCFEPFERVSIDVAGPLPVSDRKMYIIVAIDYFTKYVETKAVADFSAQSTATFLLENIIARHGAPKELISDQGRNFISTTVKQLNIAMGINHRLTAAYSPQVNGQVERINSILKNMLSKYADEYHTNWAYCLPLVTFAYNTSVQKSTKFSPFWLLYGREPRFPQELELEGRKYDNLNEYVKFIRDEWPRFRDMAKAAIMSAVRDYAHYYDERRRQVSYPIGSLVLIHFPNPVPGLADKLLSKYKGPYEVLDELSPEIYRVQATTPPRKIHIVTIQRMKPYHARQSFEIDNLPIEIPQMVSHEQSILEPIREEPEDVNTQQPMPSRMSLARPVETPTLPPTPLPSASDKPVYRKTPYPDVTKPTEKRPVGRPKGSTKSKDVQPTRASTRETRGKAPTRFSQLITLMIFNFCFIFTDGELPKAESVIWHEHPTSVVESYHQVRAIFFYKNPCRDFFAGMKESDKQRDLLNWCNDELKANFLGQLDTICTDSRVYIRQKRALFAAVAIAGILVFGVASIATAVTSLVSNQKSINKMMESTAELRKELDTLEKLTDQRIKEIERTITAIEEYTLTLIITVSGIRSGFTRDRLRLELITASWLRGQIHPNLFHLFNITLPDSDRFPFHLMRPISCIHDKQQETIVVRFQARKTSNQLYVAAADPFYFAINNGNNQYCLRTYIGPRKVILDHKTSNICPIDHYAGNVIDSNRFRLCSHSNRSFNSPWENINCQPNRRTPSEVIQVKTYIDHRYIYCPDSKIIIQHKEYTCPNYVFLLPLSVNFTLNNISFLEIAEEFRTGYSILDTPLHVLHFHVVDPGVSTSSKPGEDTSSQHSSFKTFLFYLLIVLTPIFFGFLMAFAVNNYLEYFKKRKKKIEEVETEVELGKVDTETMNRDIGYNPNLH